MSVALGASVRAVSGEVWVARDFLPTVHKVPIRYLLYHGTAGLLHGLPTGFDNVETLLLLG